MIMIEKLSNKKYITGIKKYKLQYKDLNSRINDKLAHHFFSFFKQLSKSTTNFPHKIPYKSAKQYINLCIYC